MRQSGESKVKCTSKFKRQLNLTQDPGLMAVDRSLSLNSSNNKAVGLRYSWTICTKFRVRLPLKL